MPNALYDKARQAFLNGQINWGPGVGSDEIKVALVTDAYTPNLATDQYISHVVDEHNNSAILARSTVLVDKTSDAGVADAGDTTFSTTNNNAVPAGKVKAIVIYQSAVKNQAGDSVPLPDTSAKLIAYLDQINGLPITTTATETNLTIHWDNGPNKIFKL